MKAPHNTTRRGFLKLSACAALGTLPNTHAGVIKRSQMIRWINGAILPCPTSSSFLSACTHSLLALKQGGSTFSGPETVFEFTSFLPDGSTVENLLFQKVTRGEITLGFRAFEGLGTFIQSINENQHDIETSRYWRLEVNGVSSPDRGVSQKLINTGDTVRLVLGSALNDRGIFTHSLGDYTEVLTSQVTPLWKGKILTSNDWPLDERGSLWHDFFEISAPENSYFIPRTISCTKYVERWDSATDTWIVVSTIPISTSTDGFIGRSWNSTQETSFDQTSTRMIYGGTGTGFPPVPGPGPEIPRIGARLQWLRSNKIRIRSVLEVPFARLDGSSFTEQYAWIALKAPSSFVQSVQPLSIKPGEIRFDMPPDESGLIEIQTSPDLQEWTSHGFTDDAHKVFNPPATTRMFARGVKY